MRGSSWAVPAVGYLAASVVFAWELLWPGRSLHRWDTLLYNWPLLLETREQLLSGHLPFWASSFCCGTPLLANINAGVLYPLRIVCWLLPVTPGYHIFLFVHVWLSLFGAHLLFRHGFRLAWPAAAVGALTYGFSGYARAMWDTHNFMALPWIPLALTALLEARNLPAQGFRKDAAVRFRLFLSVLGTAVCWSMMVLCGDFQAACTWGAAALLLALLMRERRRLVAVLAASALLCALLTAPQWVCSLFASLESYRAGGLDFADATEFSLHPVRLLELFIPHLFGTRDGWVGTVLAGAGAKKIIPWTTSIHFGRLALLAVFLGLRRRRRPEVKWAVLLAVGFLFLSFGRFLPGFRFWQSLPLVRSFRYPQKYLLWSVLGFAALAAFGAQGVRALLARTDRPAMRVLRVWSGILIAGAIIGSLALPALSFNAGNAAWLLKRWIGLAVVLVAAAAVGRGRGARRALVLPALVALDLFLPWRLERPTTSRFDPLEMPIPARAIRSSPSPRGRFLRDPAVRGLPLLTDSPDLTWSERWTVTQSASLDHNSPRLWGLTTAAGFSPLESARTRAYRLAAALPESGAAPGVPEFADFCDKTAVEWVLTTSDRAAQLAARLGAAPVTSWGPAGETVLLHVLRVAEAECLRRPRRSSDPPEPAVINTWRRRPGRIRVDLKPGASTRLTVKESFSGGWAATDELGAALSVGATPEGMISVFVPAGTTQVRLAYIPRGWILGSLAGLSGLCLLAAMFCATVDPARLRGVCRAPALAAAVCGLLFLIVGTAARGRWSCTFDEGFHVARGLARLRTGDSRLSYFHPPLQNLLCGYFADLAHGERLDMPEGEGWRYADVGVYAANLAGLNRNIFPDLVRAGRWGSTLLALAAIAAAVLTANAVAGCAAGWLAGLGLGLTPAMLAHGNLATTDLGVVAFVLLGTYLFRRSLMAGRGTSFPVRNGEGPPSQPSRPEPHVRDQAELRRTDALHTRRGHALWPATAAFALAAVCKFTGLVWLGAYALLCLPLTALLRRDRRVLRQIPLALLMTAVFLVCLYGFQPQTVRTDKCAWLNGKSIPAGRYLEGLLSQTGHSAAGHRAFFNGERFMRGRWWHTGASIVLKTPAIWLLAGLAGLAVGAVRAGRRWTVWLCWLPAVVFTLLLVFANRMVIGIRHALPLVAFGAVAAAVWAARLRRPLARRCAVTLLAVSALWTAAVTFPHYISYYPAWAGGVTRGHRWLVDSNYDWGQDLEVLEDQWAVLTRANGGVPPHLVYFGFADPVTIYEMPVTEPSLRGYMGQMRRRGAERESWVRELSALDDRVVIGISALQLDPYGTDFTRLRKAGEIGWVGNCFRVSIAELFSAPEAGTGK